MIFKIFNDSLILQIQILLLHLRLWTIYFISFYQCILISSNTLTESLMTLLSWKAWWSLLFLLSRDCLSSLFSHFNFQFFFGSQITLTFLTTSDLTSHLSPKLPSTHSPHQPTYIKLFYILFSLLKFSLVWIKASFIHIFKSWT